MTSMTRKPGLNPAVLRQVNRNFKSDFILCHVVRGTEEIGHVRRVPWEALESVACCNCSLLVTGA